MLSTGEHLKLLSSSHNLFSHVLLAETAGHTHLQAALLSVRSEVTHTLTPTPLHTYTTQTLHSGSSHTAVHTHTHRHTHTHTKAHRHRTHRPMLAQPIQADC